MLYTSLFWSSLLLSANSQWSSIGMTMLIWKRKGILNTSWNKMFISEMFWNESKILDLIFITDISGLQFRIATELWIRIVVLCVCVGGVVIIFSTNYTSCTMFLAHNITQKQEWQGAGSMSVTTEFQRWKKRLIFESYGFPTTEFNLFFFPLF